MSAPSRQLEELSISTGMPTTRRQAQICSSERPPETEDTSSSSDEDSSDEEATPSALARPKIQSSQSKGKQPVRSDSTTSWSDTSPSAIMSRAYQTRDILSTFDAHKLPNEFRPDIFERIKHRRTPAECLRPSDLEGTIFQLAVNDHAVYRSLDEAQPAQARAVNLFQKVMKRIRNSFMAFDEYARNGATSRVFPGPYHSVQDLGGKLHGFVHIIQAEVQERHPYGGERAAECLIYLLREVCNRDYDVFENNTWGRKPSGAESEDDHNLFQCLIGPRSIGDRPFALDALTVIPKAHLAMPDKRQQLEEIRDMLHRHYAPVAYRRAFQDILDVPVGPGGSPADPQPGQKRPAAGTGRGGHKRTK